MEQRYWYILACQVLCSRLRAIAALLCCPPVQPTAINELLPSCETRHNHVKQLRKEFLGSAVLKDKLRATGSSRPGKAKLWIMVRIGADARQS